MGVHQRKKISWHLSDLLGRDVRVLNDIVEWCKPAPGDIERRAYPKRLAARYCAAKMILAAVEEGNSGLFTHILDRTEGKVADVSIQVDGNKIIEALEAGRQRVLAAYNQDTVDGQIVTAQLDASNALDQQSSEIGRDQVARIPRGEAQGPIGGLGTISIPPSEREDVE